MSERSFLLASCLVVGVFSHAQSSGIGFKGGIQASTAKAIVIRTQPIPGGTAGIYFPCGIGPMMELQPEVLVSTLGNGWLEADGDSYIERSIYLQMPVVLKRYFGNGFNVSLGYQVGKPLLVESTNTSPGKSTLERYNDLDMGVVGGLGMDFQHGLDLSLRAYNAHTRFLRNDDALFAKHRSIQLTVGYRFHQFGGGASRRRR